MAEKSKQSGELAALKKQCEDCCKQLAELKKEVAALKKAKSSGSGADPRFETFLKAFRGHTSKWRNILEKAGL